MPEPGRRGNLFSRARECLCSSDLDEKLYMVDALQSAWQSGYLGVDPGMFDDVVEAGRPAQPELVHPRKLSRRSLASQEGRLALVHAVAHIEFNAINLACDAVFRFRDMPEGYYSDWIGVAVEEASHFRLLRQRLRAEGVDYGDYPAHNGLWDMAIRTRHDALLRMAMVPRMLEARGLDVTPGMIERLQAAGDCETAEVLALILREEIGHVALGSHWFAFLCRQRDLVPETAYFDLLNDFGDGSIRPPLNREARRQAGFSESELDRLERICDTR